MTEPTYTTAQIHHRLGVPKPTIRNWTAAYADFLSNAAQPDEGRRRLFTHTDLIVLNTIRYLTRVEGLTSREHVHDKLDSGYRVTHLPDTLPKRKPTFDDHIDVLTDTLTRIDERLIGTEQERDHALIALNRANRHNRMLRAMRIRLRGMLTGISMSAVGLLLMLIAAAMLILGKGGIP